MDIEALFQQATRLQGELQKVQIDPQAVDPKDVGMLEDLVLAAVNGALRAAQEAAAAEMPLQGLSGMLPPGFGGLGP